MVLPIREIQEIGETTRGLEKMTINYMAHGFLRQLEAREAVFMLEKEARYNNPSLTPERIARVYARLSSQSKRDASVLALHDQTFVQKELVKEQNPAWLAFHEERQHRRFFRKHTPPYHSSFQFGSHAQQITFQDHQRYILQQHHFPALIHS
jgi:hypothetical protein